MLTALIVGSLGLLASIAFALAGAVVWRTRRLLPHLPESERLALARALHVHCKGCTCLDLPPNVIRINTHRR